MRAPAMPRPAPCRSATHRPAAPAAAAVVPQPTSRRSATATSSRPLRRPSRRCTRNARPTTASRYGGAASAALHRRRRAAAVLAAAGRRGSRCVCSPQAKRAQEPRAFQNTKKYAMSVQGSNVAMKGALQLRGGVSASRGRLGPAGCFQARRACLTRSPRLMPLSFTFRRHSQREQGARG